MNQETKLIFLKSQPIFMDIDDKALQNMAAAMRVKSLKRAEAMDFEAGEYSKIYFIAKGKVKITESNDLYEEHIKDILTEGDFFGDLGLDGKFTDDMAEALTSNTVVCYFNISDFKKILQSNPTLTMYYAGTVSRKLKKLEGRHSDLVLRDAKSRLMRFIKNWAQTDGSKIGNKIILNNYLTHSDIAGFISTSRQSVNVLFNELRDSGHIYYNRKRIELNDTKAWH